MFLQLVSFDHFRSLGQSLLQLSCRDAHKRQQPHPTTSRLLDESTLLAPTAYLWGGHSYPSSTSILPSATHLFPQGVWMLGHCGQRAPASVASHRKLSLSRGRTGQAEVPCLHTTRGLC